jgi:TonB-dependent receptor
MATLNVGTTVTLTPGIRYQQLQTSYTAPQGTQDTRSSHGGPYKHYDTTVTVQHSYWLPDVLLKYKPLDWFDLRLAYTNTLAYPDYNTIVPRIDVDLAGTIIWNNPQLAPTRSQNYDIYASFHENTIGLLTIGGFWKKIDGLIYPLNFNVNDSAARPYYPQGFLSGVSFTGTYNIITAENLPNTIDNYGIELDWQTHFWYLPGALSGLVLNVNYTHVFSVNDYPYVIYIKPTPRSVPVPVDTTYSAPLLYRPDRVVNVTIGYDYQEFSVRLSLLYQTDIFTGTAANPVWLQLHTSTAAYRRWDLSFKQNLPWFDIQLYGDINNLNAARDVSVIHAQTGVPRSEQSYGLTADLGLRWRL